MWLVFFFSSRRRHTRWPRDWSSDVCSSDLERGERQIGDGEGAEGEPDHQVAAAAVGDVESPDALEEAVLEVAGEGEEEGPDQRSAEEGRQRHPVGRGRSLTRSARPAQEDEDADGEGRFHRGG